jgi:apolipoprotein N-acyltransferase
VRLTAWSDAGGAHIPNWILALLSAVLLVLTFPNVNLAFLAPVALTPLFVALTREVRVFRRFVLGWGAGVVYWLCICYWIQHDLARYGGVSDFVAWLLFLLFAIFKALHLAVFALMAGFLLRRPWAVPAVAALWVAIEVTHGHLGFAWLLLGNAGIDMSIPMRLAPITGVYGISFVFASVSAMLALAVLRRPPRELVWVVPIVLILLVLPALPKARPGTEVAVLVQPNIPEDTEFTERSLEELERHLVDVSLSGVSNGFAHPPSIVVWPEMPVPLFYDEDPRLRKHLNDLTHSTRAYLLTNEVAHTSEHAPLNSALLLSPDGHPISRYDKVNLVPFGEFVPWPFRFVNKISTGAGDFAPGTQVVASPINGHYLGVFICYESVFPNFVRQFARGGAEVLFNLSNDGWFGRSAARRQHLAIVRMRAAENRRWLMRCTNDGITATIDPAGRLLETLEPYREASTNTGFNYISEETIYTRFGDWFPGLCVVISLFCLIAERVF